MFNITTNQEVIPVGDELVVDLPKEAIDLVKRFEGLRLHPYQDSVGVWTIGYGHTKDTPPPCDGCTKPVTPEQSEEYIKNDLEHAAQGVLRQVTVPLTPNQLGALTSFAFNLGISNLGKSTLLKKLNSGDYHGAAEEFLKWNRAGGTILKGLTERRIAEKELFLKGNLSVASK